MDEKEFLVPGFKVPELVAPLDDGNKPVTGPYSAEDGFMSIGKGEYVFTLPDGSKVITDAEGNIIG